MADSPEEKAHWKDVLVAFGGYKQYHLSANHARRMAFLQLPKEDRDVYEALGILEKIEAVDEGIRQNAEFIEEMIADPVFAEMMAEHDDNNGETHSHSHADGSTSHSHMDGTGHHDHSHNHGGRSKQQHLNDGAQDKIRSTLRSFVRDWSAEGSEERKACYTPCLDALEQHFERLHGVKGKARERKNINVLVPGCGLGRLAMEVAARGFSSQGNEFSTFMLIASNFILNQTTSPESFTIFPFLHSFSNHLTTEHHLLRKVQLPDVYPAEVLSGSDGLFSLVAGDFEELYGPANWQTDEPLTEGVVAVGRPGEGSQKGKWGAVVTCFFIDCARNPLTYLKIIYEILEEDGVWINLGPLLWHYENSTTANSNGETSIELSLEELKLLARHVGFKVQDEHLIKTTYTGIPDNMLKHEYQAAFWTATKS